MLVAPVNKIEKYEERILEFKGLNKKPMIEDGEMSDMQNLCSEMYPCLYPRRKRTMQSLESFVYYGGKTYDAEEKEMPDITTGDYSRVHEIIVKRDYSNNKTDEIAAIVFGCRNFGVGEQIEETRFYYRGNRYRSVEAMFNDLSQKELRSLYMVAINSKICIFPIGIYFDTGVTDADVSSGASRCGKLYYKTELAGGGDFAIDRDKGWIKILIGTGNMSGLNKGDVVKVTGHFAFREQGANIGSITYCDGGGEMLDDSIKNPAYPVVLGVGYSPDAESTPEYIYLELTAFDISETRYVSGFTTGNIVVSRDVPELDFVFEHDNRLWGCSNKTNTIYACKLGDPTNWEYYQQTSADSYYAEQGSNGDWTGVSVYNNHMLFFKEECIVKLYGTSPSTYQTQVIYAPGVEKDSSRSLAILDSGMVIYNSPEGIMAYEGSYPYSVSKKLTNDKLVNVVGGGHFNKYYMYVNENNADVLERSVYVLDVDNAAWHKEDAFSVTQFFMLDSNMYAIGTEVIRGNHASDVFDNIFALEADRDRSEIEWYAVLGPFTEYLEDHKVYSKMDMRIKKSEDATLKFYIRVDEGEWEECNLGVSSTNLCYHQTIVPRRCHEFSIKIVGKGDVRIDSLRRRFRKGTEGDL